MKVVNVSPLIEAKNESQYFQVTFSNGTGQKKRTRNIFGFPNKETGELEWDRDTREEWLQAKASGEEIKGRILTMDIQPELVTGSDGVERSMESATFVAFADETDAQACKRAGHKPATAEVSAEEEQKVEVA